MIQVLNFFKTAIGFGPPNIQGRPTLSSKIAMFVKQVFFALSHSFLFLVNPTLFAIGLVAGVQWSEHVELSVKKVTLIWSKQPWTVCVMMTIGAALAIQVTCAAFSLFFAAKFGSYLYQAST